MENTVINKKYSAFILSAGRSTRMGVHKFSLMFNSTTTFLENLVNEYQRYGCKEIIVVLNPEGAKFLDQLNLKIHSIVKIVVNHHPEWERFYSLKLAAKALNETCPVFVSNIDNPFINLSVLDSLSHNINKADYINPVYNERGGHPFLLSEKVIDDLISEAEDQIHLKEFLGRYIKESAAVEDEKILVNINTEGDYRLLFKI